MLYTKVNQVKNDIKEDEPKPVLYSTSKDINENR